MSHITLYLDNHTESVVRAAAKRAHLSLSKWIAGVVTRAVRDSWPEEVRSAAGSWPEAPLAEQLRISEASDARRETL